MYKGYLKRLLDFCISFIGLILLSPIIISILLLLILYNRNLSIFFIQPRPGKNEKIFKLIKFKTMTDAIDNTGKLLPDADRLTPIGKFLRASSLDEIPQLINVLKGEMSLVGPRPLLVKYLSLYDNKQKIRHTVLPGITGWAQINGRNAISWKKKFEYDVYYVKNISFALDLKILFLSLKKVLTREAINQNGKATIEEFRGNNL